MARRSRPLQPFIVPLKLTWRCVISPSCGTLQHRESRIEALHAGRANGHHPWPRRHGIVASSVAAGAALLEMRRWFEGRVLISGASEVFDCDGRVADAATRDRIRTFVEGFATFTEAQRRSVHHLRSQHAFG